MQSSLPLRGFPAVHTKNLDEAADIFSKMTTPARLEKVERDASFEWRANLLSLGAVQIVANEHGAGLRGSTDAVQDVFTTAFPLVDVASLGFDAGKELQVVKDKSTWIVSPDRPGTFYVASGYRALQLTFRRADAEAALSSLLGGERAAALRIEPSLLLSSGVGAWLRRFTQFIVSEADESESPFASPIVRARLAETILFGILQGQQHNHSAQLATIRAAEPRYVTKAAEYLDAHANEAIQIADLARVTGVGVRALQLGFQKHRGCSPMAFLKERRLRLARATLLTDPQITVARAAFDSGFVHLGRFSTQYRARFGESPSKTLARSAASVADPAKLTKK